MALSRRSFLNSTPGMFAGLTSPVVQLPSSPVPGSSFPSHPPELAREMVGVAHNNLGRVKELLARWPTLARAAWDWGFGDWEEALGSASHTGQREIAETLLAHGARPSIFSAAMLGQLEVVKAFIVTSPGIEATPGPHGIPLLRHAMAGGARAQAVVDYLKAFPASDARPSSQPLTAEEMTSLTGDYVYGAAPDERLTVSVASNMLQLTRPGRSARNLVHVGDRAFFPVGAPAARIRFRQSSDGLALTVHDPDLIVEARRTR